ncbi:DUF4190 domain-containing protein [Salinicola aestuarinus]|uniref:DUF4190 domain-containing protein n=1 Tax=Salinicola aestuarinus TaxID=1949082 RepID=UPI000DA20367|nr:DUF4190 domain-containing protein [Salinicola aestuarinus]
MDGRLEAFDDDAQAGEVSAGDGTRYAFDLSQWRGRGLPRVGSAVRFDVREGRAAQVFDRPEAQRRAASTRDTTGKTRRKQLSHWALAAFVVALVGFSAGRYAPVIEVGALVLAWVALRQVHRAPERLRGTTLAAVAIVIAVGVALWSQWP